MVDCVTHMPVFASLLSGVFQSGMIGKVIVLLLVVSSIGVWYVVAEKIVEIRRAKLMTQRFLNAYSKEPHPVDLFAKNSRFIGTPLFTVYNHGCRALGLQINPQAQDRDDLFRGDLSENKLSDLQITAVRNATERSVATEALELESGMNLLAIATSTAPFLGLLGTVWGVMDAFTAMAAAGAADLSTMAPGIASALSTTIVGLLVALPAAVAYNLLAGSIRHLTVQMDNFAQEFSEEVQREF